MKIKKQNTGIITQVRMTSTRLPGKVLREIKKKPLLQFHIDRLNHTGFDIIIATTKKSTDDIICQFAEENKIKYHRGDEENVLSRYYETAAKFQLDTIVRVTSDCPLIDPVLIRENIEKFNQRNDENLYLSNVIERTYARGFDFEIFSFDALRDAHNNARSQSHVEHVTPYIHKNVSEKILVEHVKQKINNSRLRLTVDTIEDFELIKILLENYNAENLSFSEIENILLQHPEIAGINSHIEQKEIN